MKNTAAFISTYAADVSGVCSALYELDGMSIMHDASGCNSTYNTHDEPRWYDTDSLVFISALTEMEAMLGDDEKLVSDIVEAARELHPRFVALAGTPIPMITGADLASIALRVERETNIPSFAVNTNGMNSYIKGADGAFLRIAERFVNKSAKKERGSGKVNILGATPLDFSVNGSVESMAKLIREEGFAVNSVWAMGATLDELIEAGRAEANLVVSASGLSAARFLERTFSTPYVTGVPIGESGREAISRALSRAIETNETQHPFSARPSTGGKSAVIIGEGIYSLSLAHALSTERGMDARVLCSVEIPRALMNARDAQVTDEDDILEKITPTDTIIADPLYAPLAKRVNAEFVPLPHEAFSGRIYRKEIPDLTGKKLEDFWK